MTRAGNRSYLAWVAAVWLAVLAVLSYRLWGTVLTSTPWLTWARAFGGALMGTPRIFFLHGAWWGIAVLAAGALTGKAVVGRLVPEHAPLSLCAGGGLIILAIAGEALGAAGLYRPGALIALVAAAGVLGGADLFQGRRRGAGKPRAVARLNRAELAGLIFCGAIIFVTALNPTLFYDALYYHLSLPRYYLFAGSTEPVTWHAFSYFPSNLEMMHGTALAGGGVLAAQVMLAGVWLFAVLMVRDLATRFIGPEAGPWALGVALACIGFALSALVVTTDVFVMLLTMGGLYAVCGAADASAREDDASLRAWLICWGLMAGGAAGAKYTAWISGIGLQGLLVAGITLKRMRIKTLDTGLGVAALVLFPWVLRAYWASGNPVMPVPVDGLFAGLTGPAWQALKIDAHAVSWAPGDIAANLASPWTMVFSSWDRLIGEWGEASFIGPAVWMGAPLLLVFRRGSRASRLIVAYGLAALCLAVGMNRMTRFAFPGIGALAAAAGGGLAAWRAAAAERKWARYAGYAALATAAVLYAALLLRTSANLSTGYAFPRVSGDMGRYMELRAKKNAFEAATVPLQLEANEKLPRDAEVLFVGETRSFYLDRKAIAPSYLDRNPLLDLLERGSDEAAARSLRKEGITHVLVSMPELKRLAKGYGVVRFDPEIERRLNAFTHGPWCRPVQEDERAGAVICELNALPQAI